MDLPELEEEETVRGDARPGGESISQHLSQCHFNQYDVQARFGQP